MRCCLPVGWGGAWIVILGCIAGPAWSAGPGKEDLDRAIQIKLTAEKLDELGDAINACQRALDKGLDDEDEAFAQQLLASTLSQRGELLSDSIFKADQPDARWPAIRRMALADFERSLRAEPSQAKVHLQIARLQGLPGGDRDKALAAVDSAVRLTRQDPDLRYEALVMRATLRESTDDKLGDLGEAIELRPKDPGTIRARGALLMTVDQPERALADFDAALKLDPEHALTHEARGAALAILQRFDESKQAYDRALELAPRSTTALLQRAQVHLLEDRTEEALADLESILKLDPEHLPAWMFKLRIHLARQAWDAAQADIRALLAIEPDLPPALRARAQLALQAGRIHEAIADLETILRQDRRDLETQFQLALLYRTDKQFGKSLELFDALIQVKPDAWFVFYGRADTYLAIGKHREARADYERAHELHPDDSGLLNNFAWLLATSPDEQVRDGRRAIELATKACELTQHKQPHILSTLAAGYAEAGDFESAERWSRRGIELCEPALRETLEKELTSYQQKKPWRELQREDQAVSQRPGGETSR